MAALRGFPVQRPFWMMSSLSAMPKVSSMKSPRCTREPGGNEAAGDNDPRNVKRKKKKKKKQPGVFLNQKVH